MLRISISIQGMEVDFDLAGAMAKLAALRQEQDTMLISWNDRCRDIHSPSCLKCEIKGEQGWEVYGRNHNGRLRVSVNDDDFVFIYGG